MNKKGLVVDAMEFIVVLITIVILLLIVSIIVSINEKSKEDKFNLEKSKIDASFNTRILLDYELVQGYKLYQAIIDGVNNNDPLIIESSVASAINGFYGDTSTDGWIFIVNDEIKSYRLSRADLTRLKEGEGKVLNFIPRTNIPNPEGKKITIVIKRIVPEDYNEVEKGFWSFLSSALHD